MRKRLGSVLFTLWAVLVMLGAHATPAYAYAQVAGRSGVESAAASKAGDREAVSAGTSRANPDARKLERSPRPAPQAPLATTWATTNAAQPLVLAASLHDFLPPVSWIGWETASRARARLMVFLN